MEKQRMLCKRSMEGSFGVDTPKKRHLEPAFVQTRSFVSFFVDTLKGVPQEDDINLKNGLLSLMKLEHHEALKKTPFYHFLRFPTMHLSRTLLYVILSLWDIDRRGIIVGDAKQFLPLDVQEISVIIGLPSYGEKICLDNKSDSDCLTRLFEGKHIQSHRAKLRSLLFELVHDISNEKVMDFVRVFIMLVCATVLFPTTNYYVPRWLFPYLDNINEISKLAWGASVHEDLLKRIPDTALNIKKFLEGRIANIGFFNGCGIVLTAWIYEHCPRLIENGRGTVCRPKEIPRLFQWCRAEKHKFSENLLMRLKSMKPSEIIVDFAIEPYEISLVQRLKEENNNVEVRESLHSFENVNHLQIVMATTCRPPLTVEHCCPLQQRVEVLEAEVLELKEVNKTLTDRVFTLEIKLETILRQQNGVNVEALTHVEPNSPFCEKAIVVVGQEERPIVLFEKDSCEGNPAEVA